MLRLGHSAARLLLAGSLALGGQGLAAWEVERMLSAASALGVRVEAAATDLRQLIEQARTQHEVTRLTVVNDFFNQRIEFRSDREVWQQEDFWTSPLILLAKGQGDCEDYAIAKYASLVAADVPVSSLRLVYVRARLAGASQAHMVLAYYPTPNADPLILDNLSPELKTASKRSDLTPVFSFNGEGLWQGVGARAAGDPLTRLSHWREVLSKMRAEGFL